MLLVAHRGDTVHFPENTVEAFRSALVRGAGGIEMDVHVDHGEPVIVHHYIRPKSQVYPKLSDVIREFKDRGHLEIEIKSFTYNDVKIITDLITELHPPDIEVTSSVHPVLSYIKDRLPKTQIGSIFPNKFLEEWMNEDFMIEHLEGFMKLTHADVIHFPPSLYSKKVISTLKTSYVTHHHIKTADKKEYDRLSDLGIDRVTFDDIRLLKAI